MTFGLMITVAIIMALFACFGYYRGTLATLIALLVFFGAFVIVETMSETIVTLLNGLYIGVMLVLRSGLSDIASGDLESAAGKLESIQKPFDDANANVALLMVLTGALATGLLIGLFFKKKKPSFLGGIFGLSLGYLVAAAFLPLINLFNVSPEQLPVPIVRPAPPPVQAQAVGLSQFLATLSQPGNVQIVAAMIAVAIALFLILALTRAGKRS